MIVFITFIFMSTGPFQFAPQAYGGHEFVECSFSGVISPSKTACRLTMRSERIVESGNSMLKKSIYLSSLEKNDHQHIPIIPDSQDFITALDSFLKTPTDEPLFSVELPEFPIVTDFIKPFQISLNPACFPVSDHTPFTFIAGAFGGTGYLELNK